MGGNGCDLLRLLAGTQAPCVNMWGLNQPLSCQWCTTRVILPLVCVIQLVEGFTTPSPQLHRPVTRARSRQNAFSELRSQVCPSLGQIPLATVPASTSHGVTLWDAPLTSHTHAMLLADTPLDGVKDYLLSHPLQDVVAITLLLFTIEFIKQGASLPTAIVAACLQLLNRIPGFTMIGQKPLLKLAISVVIDIVGVASFLLPFVGEVGDLGWAPTSAILVKALYNSNVLASVGLVEEFLPGADIIPTATIGWMLEYVPGVSQLGWVSGMAAIPGKDKAQK